MPTSELGGWAWAAASSLLSSSLSGFRSFLALTRRRLISTRSTGACPLVEEAVVAAAASAEWMAEAEVGEREGEGDRLRGREEVVGEAI